MDNFQTLIQALFIFTHPFACRIGALYFDEEKLKELVGQVAQNLALYEKLRVVGKGKRVVQLCDVF